MSLWLVCRLASRHNPGLASSALCTLWSINVCISYELLYEENWEMAANCSRVLALQAWQMELSTHTYSHYHEPNSPCDARKWARFYLEQVHASHLILPDWVYTWHIYIYNKHDLCSPTQWQGINNTFIFTGWIKIKKREFLSSLFPLSSKLLDNIKVCDNPDLLCSFGRCLQL